MASSNSTLFGGQGNKVAPSNSFTCDGSQLESTVDGKMDNEEFLLNRRLHQELVNGAEGMSKLGLVEKLNTLPNLLTDEKQALPVNLQGKNIFQIVLENKNHSLEDKREIFIALINHYKNFSKVLAHSPLYGEIFKDGNYQGVIELLYKVIEGDPMARYRMWVYLLKNPDEKVCKDFIDTEIGREKDPQQFVYFVQALFKSTQTQNQVIRLYLYLQKVLHKKVHIYYTYILAFRDMAKLKILSLSNQGIKASDEKKVQSFLGRSIGFFAACSGSDQSLVVYNAMVKHAEDTNKLAEGNLSADEKTKLEISLPKRNIPNLYLNEKARLLRKLKDRLDGNTVVQRVKFGLPKQ